MLDSKIVGYLDRIGRCDDPARVAQALEREVVSLDLSAVCCSMLTGPKAAGPDRFYSDNWVRPWRAAYEQRRLVHKDPLARWAISSGAPTTWTALAKRLRAHDPAHEVLALARSFGHREAFVSPVRTPRGHLGLVSLHGDRRPLGAAEQFFLGAICPGTLHRLEALAGPGEAAHPASPLSQREQECAALLAQGYSNPAIAARLGISVPTVKFHLGNASGKLGARSRSQLASLIPSPPSGRFPSSGAAWRGGTRPPEGPPRSTSRGYGPADPTMTILRSADGRLYRMPVEAASAFEIPVLDAGAAEGARGGSAVEPYWLEPRGPAWPIDPLRGGGRTIEGEPAAAAMDRFRHLRPVRSARFRTVGRSVDQGTGDGSSDHLTASPKPAT